MCNFVLGDEAAGVFLTCRRAWAHGGNGAGRVFAVFVVGGA